MPETTPTTPTTQSPRREFCEQTLGMLDQIRMYGGKWKTRNLEQTFNGTPDFGRKVTVSISRNGNLVVNPMVVIELNKDDVSRYRDTPEALINSIELEIGGARIDKIYPKMLPLYWHIYDLNPTVYGSKFYLPIPFGALIGNNAVAFPKYHEVKLNVEFGEVGIPADTLSLLKDLNVRYQLPSFVNASIFVDYITLPDSHYDHFKPIWFPSNRPSSRNNLANFGPNDSSPKQLVTINTTEYTGAELISLPNHHIKLNFTGGSMGFFLYFDDLVTFKTLKLTFNGKEICEGDYATFRYLNWSKLKVKPPTENYLFVPLCDCKIQEQCDTLVSTSNINKIDLAFTNLDYSNVKEGLDGVIETCVHIGSISKLNMIYQSGMAGMDWRANFSDEEEFQAKGYISPPMDITNIKTQ